MKRQRFIITGKSHHIMAITQDLLYFGYMLNGFENLENLNKAETYHILSSAPQPRHIHDYKKIMCRRNYDGIYYLDDMKKFTLPEQYNEALEFCKQQFELWKKPQFKKGQWVYFRYEKDEPVIGKARASTSEYADLISLEETFNSDDEVFGYSLEYCRHATDEEIIEHLLKEAERRGLKDGVKYRPVGIFTFTGNKSPYICEKLEFTFIKDRLIYDSEYNSLLISCGTGFIYCQGVFAEVIKEEKNIKVINFGDTELNIDFNEKVIYYHGHRKITFNDFSIFYDKLKTLTLADEYRIQIQSDSVIRFGCATGTMKELSDINYMIAMGGSIYD